MTLEETKQKAYKMFWDIRKKITDEKLLKFYDAAWDKLPDYWFLKTASSTGKYHPRFANGELGLVKHSLYATKVWQYLWRGFKHEFGEDLLKYQAGIIAIVFHDALKYGKPEDNNRHTTSTHPEDAAEWIVDIGETLGIDSDLLGIIHSAIAHHQGPWSNYGPPVTLFDKLIFIADYVASQPTFEEEIFKCE